MRSRSGFEGPSASEFERRTVSLIMCSAIRLTMLIEHFSLSNVIDRGLHRIMTGFKYIAHRRFLGSWGRGLGDGLEVSAQDGIVGGGGLAE